MQLKTDKDQFLLAKKINLDLGPDVSPPKIEQFRPQKCIFFVMKNNFNKKAI